MHERKGEWRGPSGYGSLSQEQYRTKFSRWILRRSSPDLGWNGMEWVALDAKPIRYTVLGDVERAQREIASKDPALHTWIEEVYGDRLDEGISK